MITQLLVGALSITGSFSESKPIGVRQLAPSDSIIMSAGFDFLPLCDFLNGHSCMLSYCVKNVESLANLFGNYQFGSWTIISFEQTNGNCASVACLDLAYSYYYTNGTNLTGGLSWYSNLQLLEYYQGYTEGYGVTLADLVSGFEEWTEESYSLSSCAEETTIPTVGIYEDNQYRRHMALKIGKLYSYSDCQYWDLVVSLNKNFIGNNNYIFSITNLETCLFVIPSAFRVANYKLQANQ